METETATEDVEPARKVEEGNTNETHTCKHLEARQSTRETK